MLPTFTLRGHDGGVTSLAQLRDQWLISGDENGNLALWNYRLKKRHSYYACIAKSRIQSLKCISLLIHNKPCDILVCQSRDNGVSLLDITNQPNQLQPLITFESFPSLFSRGDAFDIAEHKAILAYPSSLANHLVTVRVLGDDVKTKESGSAQRYALEGEKSCAVFDIKLKEHPKEEKYLNLYVAYEDGCLCVFNFRHDVTRSVPTLNAEGIDIKLIRKFDLKVNDFISAFDISHTSNGSSMAVCGSPNKSLIFLTDNLNSEDSSPIINTIQLKRRGVSTLIIEPRERTVVLGGWDNVIYQYCLNSLEVIGSFKHSKQLQDLCFIKNDHTLENNSYDLCCASMHGVILTIPNIQKDE